MTKNFYFSFLFFLTLNSILAQSLYKGSGNVSFISDAPLETVKAQSTKLNGLIDLDKKTFAFTIDVSSFEGFNSPLQKEHFNEHYLETKKFPKSTFTGNIISELNCTGNCDQIIICKGKFSIHGITKIETINIHLKKTNQKIDIQADFEILLSDYNIKIPKIVQAKIATDIQLKVQMQLNQINE
jgi:polyisoprenoid-binding protein YceI